MIRYVTQEGGGLKAKLYISHHKMETQRMATISVSLFLILQALNVKG